MPAIWFWHKTNLPQLARYFVSLITIPSTSMCWMEFVMTRVSSSYSAKAGVFKELMLYTYLWSCLIALSEHLMKWQAIPLSGRGILLLMHTSHAKFCVYSNFAHCGMVHLIHWKSDSGFTGKAVDIVQAVEHIITLKNVLSNTRSHIDVQFHAMYERASRQACSDLQSGTTNSSEMC